MEGTEKTRFCCPYCGATVVDNVCQNPRGCVELKETYAAQKTQQATAPMPAPPTLEEQLSRDELKIAQLQASLDAAKKSMQEKQEDIEALKDYAFGQEQRAQTAEGNYNSIFGQYNQLKQQFETGQEKVSDLEAALNARGDDLKKWADAYRQLKQQTEIGQKKVSDLEATLSAKTVEAEKYKSDMTSNAQLAAKWYDLHNASQNEAIRLKSDLNAAAAKNTELKNAQRREAAEYEKSKAAYKNETMSKDVQIKNLEERVKSLVEDRIQLFNGVATAAQYQKHLDELGKVADGYAKELKTLREKHALESKKSEEQIKSMQREIEQYASEHEKSQHIVNQYDRALKESQKKVVTLEQRLNEGEANSVRLLEQVKAYQATGMTPQRIAALRSGAETINTVQAYPAKDPVQDITPAIQSPANFLEAAKKYNLANRGDILQFIAFAKNYADRTTPDIDACILLGQAYLKLGYLKCAADAYIKAMRAVAVDHNAHTKVANGLEEVTAKALEIAHHETTRCAQRKEALCNRIASMSQQPSPSNTLKKKQLELFASKLASKETQLGRTLPEYLSSYCRRMIADYSNDAIMYYDLLYQADKLALHEACNLIDKKQYSDAFAVLDEAIAIDPWYSWAYPELIDICKEREDLDTEIRILEHYEIMCKSNETVAKQHAALREDFLRRHLAARMEKAKLD